MDYETRSTDLSWMNWLGALAVGALAMYIADPSQGRRRRALMQDKVTSATHKASTAVNQRVHDARNRLSGLQAEASRLLSPRHAKPIDDHVLEARVRSRLGRAMPDLHHIEVAAHQGTVTLGGNIDTDTAEALEHVVKAIPGVEAVQHAGTMPGLASHLVGRLRAGQSMAGVSALLTGSRGMWIAGAVGAGLLTWYGVTRRAPLGLVAAATGLGLLARGTSQMQPARMNEATGGAFEAQKTIEIRASAETVFDVWSRYDNFPHFMSHVIEVRDLGQNRSHWIMQGPAGVDVEWDSVLTQAQRPHRLAWQSEPNSNVENQGTVILEAVPGGTRATISLTWRPPAGAAGQGIAVLLGADPERALEEDLQRMKQFIERGVPAPGQTETTSASSTILH